MTTAGRGRGFLITPEAEEKFRAALNAGCSIADAARRSGMSYNSGLNRVARMKKNGHDPIAARRQGGVKPLPTGWAKLEPRARKAWDDFEFFRLTYMGHPSEDWAVQMAEQVVNALESPHKEYFVVNIAPGIGKTTILHDIAAWVTVRNRSIRGAFISKNSSNGQRMMMRLRRTLERTTPAKARDEDVKHGLAVDAVACLAVDYGLFKPLTNADIWRNDEFVVVQADDMPIDEKEPTWSSYGMKSDVLSNRYDLMLCDDTDDNSTIRTMDAAETWRAKWDDEIENRLEPRGVLFHVGQRFGSNDLYGYNLAKRVPLDPTLLDEMTADEQEAAVAEQPGMYRHIVFKAHDETKCQGKETHRFDSPAWPNGCLLSPKRLPWREIATLKSTKPRSFVIQYQQEDADPESVLVKKAWVYGGTDIDEITGAKFQAPGCWDSDRGLCELPKGLNGPLYSFATVDPSVSKMWAFQWWVAAPDAFNQLFLMDCVRVSLPANEVLDWDANTQQHYGLMEEWQRRSAQTPWPIKTWIIEANAAHKHFLQYQHMANWIRKWTVDVRPHQTTLNKHDPSLGIDMVRDWWKYGRIRLPGRSGPPAFASMKLVEEVTRFPNAGTDDQVMANWFAILHLPTLCYVPKPLPQQPRPSWVAGIPDGRSLRLVGAS